MTTDNLQPAQPIHQRISCEQGTALLNGLYTPDLHCNKDIEAGPRIKTDVHGANIVTTFPPVVTYLSRYRYV